MPSSSLELVGTGTNVPLVTGEWVRYVNLDYAASAPALQTVARAIEEFLPWYSAVHRGAGFKSRVATDAYEQARVSVARFFGARPDDEVIFTRNTTDSINLFESAVPPDVPILAFAGEHHANLLPWRRREISYLPFPGSPDEALAQLTHRLRDMARPPLVTVTGASNVTGEIWPLAEIVEIAHRAGSRELVHAAQLAPHQPIEMAELGLD
jgi:selenocysteine lyase/cysteine desulfurase